jgi:hypothetical protein
MRRNINISLEPEVYQGTKKVAPGGEISPFVNNLLKEHLKKIKQEKLIAGYKSTARSKAVKEEDKIWEGSIEDGINE